MRTAACALTLVCVALAAHATDAAPPEPRPTPLFSNLPLLFVENHGQLDEAVRFSVPGAGRTLYFARDGITVALEGDGRRWAQKLDFVDANPDVVLRGEEAQQAVFSYFKGNDPEKWHAGCPTYARILYEDLWPGIDLVYRGEVNRIKHEFVVAPGADPRRIRFAVRGATVVRLDADGDLVLETPLGSFEDARPIAYQERDGARVEIDAAFALDGTQVAFTLGPFDPTLPLVLDPETIVYSGYLGGSSVDTGRAIAVDATGAAYVVGSTNSSDFPKAGGLDPSFNGQTDAFVAKVDPTGSALVYSGFLGGFYIDHGRGIAVDASGAAYVTGNTLSYDFPTLGDLDPTFNGNSDAFVAKIFPTGAGLVYSAFLGGGFDDIARGIAVDAAGAVYLTGSTRSENFPWMGPLDPSHNGGLWDGFLLKIDPAGSSLVYSGFLGGSGLDYGQSVAVDAPGAAYVTGWTNSSDFPTAGSLDPIHNGGWDGFVLKVDPNGSSFLYSGFLGGSDVDYGHGIAVDASGAAYVTGTTRSSDFPTVGDLGPTLRGGADAFVSKVSPLGDGLVYSGTFGAATSVGEGDAGWGIRVDPAGSAYVAGSTESQEGVDAFIAKVSAAGDAMDSILIGGSGADYGSGIDLDLEGGIYVTGSTTSPDFPMAGSLDPTFNGQTDAFVARMDASFIRASFLCRLGTVEDPEQPESAIVLRVNGSKGDLSRVVVATIGSQLTITMDVPPSGPNPAPFAMYGWVGEPSESTVTPHPKGVGTMCFPTPVTGGLPQPSRIWNNIGHFEVLGYPHFPSEPAPSTLFSKVWGIPFAITATFQGFVLDDGSLADKPASITNAVILQVIP